jgi:mRNA interferase YafQ
MRRPSYSGQFKRDVKLAQKRGKKMEKLRVAMQILIDGQPLDRAYLDHPLKGDWKGCRDLHIEPDWLLIGVPVATDPKVRFSHSSNSIRLGLSRNR